VGIEQEMIIKVQCEGKKFWERWGFIIWSVFCILESRKGNAPSMMWKNKINNELRYMEEKE